MGVLNLSRCRFNEGNGTVIRPISEAVNFISDVDTVLYFDLQFADNAPEGVRISAKVTCEYEPA